MLMLSKLIHKNLKVLNKLTCLLFFFFSLKRRKPHLIINNETKAHGTRGLYNEQTKQKGSGGVYLGISTRLKPP